MPWLINNRDHRKLLIVDGRTVILGGINISSVYSTGSIFGASGKTDRNEGPWRDTDLRIEGPAWERRPLGLRLKEWAARMWARLL